jgi:hypothetical protein
MLSDFVAACAHNNIIGFASLHTRIETKGLAKYN